MTLTYWLLRNHTGKWASRNTWIFFFVLKYLTCKYTQKHVRVRMHTHTHTHTYTHTHTHIYIYIWNILCFIDHFSFGKSEKTQRAQSRHASGTKRSAMFCQKSLHKTSKMNFWNIQIFLDIPQIVEDFLLIFALSIINFFRKWKMFNFLLKASQKCGLISHTNFLGFVHWFILKCLLKDSISVHWWSSKIQAKLIVYAQ